MLIGNIEIEDDTRIILSTRQEDGETVAIDVELGGKPRHVKALGATIMSAIGRAICNEYDYNPKKLLDVVGKLLGSEGDGIIERQE